MLYIFEYVVIQCENGIQYILKIRLAKLPDQFQRRRKFDNLISNRIVT